MTFEITILGCGAATPTSRYHPSAQVIHMHDKLFLVDCGEGTQMQLRKFKIRMQRINHIFISHLHGDHYLGLMGLLSSMHLLGRGAPMHLYGPPDLKEMVEVSLRLSQTWLVYPLHFHTVSGENRELIMEDDTLQVFSVPLRHRIECHGYVFVEKPRSLSIRHEKIRQYSLLPSEIVKLKNGAEVKRADGSVIHPDQVCSPPKPLRSYAYCSDTAFSELLAQCIKGVNLLYHESTFLEKEKKRAKETFHSTAGQAAQIAAMADAGSLILGHFSSRYEDMDGFLEEARPFFPAVVLAEEGKTFQVPFAGTTTDQN